MSSSPRFVDDEDMPDDDDFGEAPHIIINASQPFSFSQLGLPSSRAPRAGIVISRRTPPSKAKAFFDDIVNMPSPTLSNGEGTSVPPLRSPPRIIYIRDYPTLASTSSSWFSSLVASVRAHRQGPLSRPTSPITNPVTIVFGITPPIFPLKPPSSVGMPTGLFNLLMSRRSNSGFAQRSGGKSINLWDESETAQTARERRLRDRLKHWENGDPSFYDELPDPPAVIDRGADQSSQPATELVINGPSGQSLASGLIAARVPPEAPAHNDKSFFRTSVIVPQTRVAALEKECRIGRRRHINELIMRMAVGEIGGVLPESFESPFSAVHQGAGPLEEQSQGEPVNEEEDFTSSTSTTIIRTDMWGQWGERVESWSNVKEIADRAVGSVVGALVTGKVSDTHITNPSLDPTPVPWSTVYSAWRSQRHSRRRRKVWIEESTSKVEDDRAKPGEEEAQVENDEVIERVKRDHTLDSHESRLLGCIVDPGIRDKFSPTFLKA